MKWDQWFFIRINHLFKSFQQQSLFIFVIFNQSLFQELEYLFNEKNSSIVLISVSWCNGKFLLDDVTSTDAQNLCPHQKSISHEGKCDPNEQTEFGADQFIAQHSKDHEWCRQVISPQPSPFTHRWLKGSHQPIIHTHIPYTLWTFAYSRNGYVYFFYWWF